MTDMQAIEKRTSRRAYSGGLSRAEVNLLAEKIASANLACGLNIQLLEDGSAFFNGITKSYGMFKGVRGVVVLAGREGDEHLRENCGRCGERLVLEATKMGLGACWVAGTFDRGRLQHNLPAGQALAAVITVGPVKEEKGLVEKAVSRLAGGKAGDWHSLCGSIEGAPPAWFEAGVKAAFAAPSAMNKKPVRFSWDGQSAFAAVPSEEGTFPIDLGIAKLHFEIAAGGTFAPGNGAAFTKGE